MVPHASTCRVISVALARAYMSKPGKMFRDAALILFLILALRLPFLNQAIQGDDFYYLKGAEYALVDPLHPLHGHYAFLGEMRDMRGHPHGPANPWFLAALLALSGGEKEPVLHAGFILFSLIAALSVYAIARRFTEHPLAATALFIVSPAFLINGNSLEADVPFVAFFLAAVAFFIYEQFAAAAIAGGIAALTAYQGIVLAPILLYYNRRTLRAWIAALAPALAIVAFQLFERFTSSALPAQMLTAYLAAHNFESLVAKVKSAAALTAHTAWIVFPLIALLAFWRVPVWAMILAGISALSAAIYDPNPLFWASFAIGVLIIVNSALHWRDFLNGWILIFFAAALAVFFAGSARYLLPIAAPIAILAAQRVHRKWLYAGGAASAVLSLALAVVNYQHWDGYRKIKPAGERVFVNGEWGIRHYLENDGALPYLNQQSFRPGDVLVSTAYAPPVGNALLAQIATHEITSSIPLRLIALGAKSGYSSVAFGLRPFDISTAPMDRVRIQAYTERAPVLSALKIGTPDAAAQIITGIYNSDRWTGAQPTVILKRPANASLLEATFYIPPQSPARTLSLYADGTLLKQETYAGPGVHVIAAPAPSGNSAVIMLAVDKTFTVPPDERRLGVLLTEIRFR